MAVTVDSQMASSVAANVIGATSLTYSFTNTAGTYLVVVGELNGTTGVSSPTETVTYNGVSATKYAASEIGWATHGGIEACKGACFTLQSPATGANNVVVTASVSYNIISGAISVTGAATVNAESNGTTNFNDGSSTASPALTLTSVKADSLCLAWYGCGSAIQTPTLNAGQVQSAFKDVDTNNGGNNFTMTRFTGSGTLTPTCTSSFADRWGDGAMEILAPASGGARMMSLMGVGLGVRLLAAAQLRRPHSRRRFFKSMCAMVLGPK